MVALEKFSSTQKKKKEIKDEANCIIMRYIIRLSSLAKYSVPKARAQELDNRENS